MLGRGMERAARAVLEAWGRRQDIPRRGRVAVPGLAAPVRVAFDAWGVPHVRAATDGDALAALGFLHATHRFFQMDMMRRVLSGRLAETVGERPLGELSLPPFDRKRTTVDADRLMRGLDLVGAARRYLRTGGEEGRALLAAYVGGVNGALRVLRRRRPLEHRLLRLPVRPWSMLDSVLLVKGMALGLSFKWRASPVLSAVAEALRDRPALLDDLLPAAPRAGDLAVARLVTRGVAGALSFLPSASPPAGSNAFLVGGGLSASGAPILANDPHLELSLPSIWFLASVRGRRYAAVGATLPGVPGVVIGRTPLAAWGLTNGMVDDGDLWEEGLDPTGTRYRLEGAWRPLALETQSIARRGRAPAAFRLRRTHRGPLLSDAFPGYEGPPLSLRLTLHDAAQDMEAFLGFGRARVAEDVDRAALGFGSPAQNVLFADTRGDGGYRLMGHVPLRDPHPVHPGLVRDGGTRATDWRGYVPVEDMPALRLSARDRIVSANHPQVDGTYPHYLGHYYEPPHRARRIHALLAGREGLTASDLADLQTDVRNGAVDWFGDLVLRPHAEAVRRARPSLGRLLDRLLAWDGVEAADRAGPALWHLTYHHLARRTFGHALGEGLLAGWMGLINFVDDALRRAFEAPEGGWAPPATRPSLLQAALEDAERDLRARGLGTDAPWGVLHRLWLRHPAGRAPGLGPTFDRGPYPMPGGPYTVCAGQYLHPRPCEMFVGASYRQVVDLGAPEEASRMITYGGQSGVVGTAHYDDLQPLWQEGEAVPMRLETWPRTAEVLTLLPG